MGNFGWVSKRTYEISQNNNKVLNQRNMDLAQQNRELQLRIQELERENRLKDEELVAFKKNKVEKVAPKKQRTTKKKAE